MAFDVIERSRFLGKPIHLFRFARQNLVWRFCTADRDLVIDGFTYVSAAIERSEIRQTSERVKDQLTIKVPYLRNPAAAEYPSTQSLGDNWHPYTPSDPITITCMATHYGDTDPPVVEWMGIVTQPSFSDTELELTCEPGPAISQAVGQGPKWQRGCWKTVYSTGLRGCNLALDAFKVDAALEDVVGLTITAPEFAEAPLPLDGGWVEWERVDGLIERRSVMQHAGESLAVLYGAGDLAPGLAVTVRPGCGQTWAACEARGNTINYGGAIYKPVKDPTKDSMSWG